MRIGVLGRLAVLALASIVACCGSDGAKSTSSEPFFPADFETTYSRVRTCRFSIEHDGSHIEVFANAIGAEAYATGTYPLPSGAVIVKTLATSTACSDRTGYAVMKKDASGEWLWQSLDADRVVDTDLDTARCAKCHARCTNGRDGTCADPL